MTRIIIPRSLPAVRWVQVLPDGTEINHDSPPRFDGTLRVEIVMRRADSVIERTWAAGKVRGRGWKRDPDNDDPNGDYFGYVRTRRVSS